MIRAGVLLALSAALALAAEPEALTLETGHTVSGTLTGTEAKHWRIHVPAHQYVRLHATAPTATVALLLQNARGDTVGKRSSIGGTGGAAVLAWITADTDEECTLIATLAGAYAQSASFELAIDEVRPARPGEDPLSYPPLAAAELLAKGQALIGSKHTEDALAVLKQALEAARALHDSRLEAQALYRIGMAHYYRDERGEAADALSRALSIQRTQGQPFETALTLNNLASVKLVTGACQEAQAGFREALAIREEHNDQRGMGYTLLGLSNSLYCTGNAQDALDADLRALAVWRDLKDEANQADTENTLGLIYLDMGDADTAARQMNSALVLWRKSKNRLGEGNSTYNLALIEVARGNTTAAKKLEQDALAIFRSVPDKRGEAYVLEALGESYGRAGDHAKALEYFEQSRALLDALHERYEAGYLWQALGSEYVSLKRLQDARAAYDRALGLEQQVGDGNGEAVTFFRRAQLQRSQGDHAAALADTNSAIELVEQSRRQVLDPAHRATYLSTRRDIYVLKVALLTATREREKAFEASDSAHARTLLDEVAETGMQAPQTTLATVAQLRAALPANAVAIEYLVGNSRGYAWCVTRNRIFEYPLPGRAELERAVRSLYEAMLARTERQNQETLKSRANRLAAARVERQRATELLRSWLIAPIPPAILSRTLLVVPDGPLYFVPFSLLVPEREIVETASAAVFVAKAQRPGTKAYAPILAIANPKITGDEMPNLTFANAEVSTLASLVRGPEIQISEKDEATREVLLDPGARRYGLIHIAAHAVADAQHPSRSGILLSDGVLNAAAISRLRLGARLVVLSACDTALGKEIAGEGIMSLSRAFLYAGSRTVLATLWAVDDQATSVFMRHFYAALFAGANPTQALRQAQTSMRSSRTWSDPYYWAAFALQGMPR